MLLTMRSEVGVLGSGQEKGLKPSRRCLQRGHWGHSKPGGLLMRMHRKIIMSAALCAALAIGVCGVCGLCSAPLFAQDTNKSSQRTEQAEKKKPRAKQPSASRARNATGAPPSSGAQSAPAFPVNGY